jgi:hypothetical protein
MARPNTVREVEALVSNLAKLNDAVSAASANVSAAELADDFDKASQSYKNLAAAEKKAKNEAKVVQEQYNKIVGDSAQEFKELAESQRNFKVELEKNSVMLRNLGLNVKGMDIMMTAIINTQGSLLTQISNAEKLTTERSQELGKKKTEELKQEVIVKKQYFEAISDITKKLNTTIKDGLNIKFGGDTTIDYAARAAARRKAEELGDDDGFADLRPKKADGTPDERFTTLESVNIRQDALDALELNENLEDLSANINNNLNEALGPAEEFKNKMVGVAEKIPIIGGAIGKEINKRFSKAVSIIEDDLIDSLSKQAVAQKATGTGIVTNIGLQEMFNRAVAKNPYTAIAMAILAALTFITSLFMFARKTQRAARDLANELSLGRDQLEGQFIALKAQELKFKAMNLDADKLKTTLTTLSTTFKDLELVTAENAANIEKFAQFNGISSDEVVKLSKQLMITEGVSFDMALSMQQQAAAMAKTAGIAKGRVLNDMASNAEEFARFSQQGAEGLAEAAVAANQMGLNLTKVMKVAGELLDFESSITKEFEAQVLTGRALNLEAARQAALSGDQDSLMREIKSVAMGVNLETMNVVQKDAIAGAIGLSVSDLMRVSRGESLDKQDTMINLQKQGNEIALAAARGSEEKLEKIANNQEKNIAGPNAFGGIVETDA